MIDVNGGYPIDCDWNLDTFLDPYDYLLQPMKQTIKTFCVTNISTVHSYVEVGEILASTDEIEIIETKIYGSSMTMKLFPNYIIEETWSKTKKLMLVSGMKICFTVKIVPQPVN